MDLSFILLLLASYNYMLCKFKIIIFQSLAVSTCKGCVIFVLANILFVVGHFGDNMLIIVLVKNILQEIWY